MNTLNKEVHAIKMVTDKEYAERYEKEQEEMNEYLYQEYQLTKENKMTRLEYESSEVVSGILEKTISELNNELHKIKENNELILSIIYNLDRKIKELEQERDYYYNSLFSLTN